MKRQMALQEGANSESESESAQLPERKKKLFG